MDKRRKDQIKWERVLMLDDHRVGAINKRKKKSSVNFQVGPIPFHGGSRNFAIKQVCSSHTPAPLI